MGGEIDGGVSDAGMGKRWSWLYLYGIIVARRWGQVQLYVLKISKLTSCVDGGIPL